VTEQRIIPDHELGAGIMAAGFRHRAALNKLIEKFAGAGKTAADIPQTRRLDFIRAMEELMQ
jgi:hypothetical protein